MKHYLLTLVVLIPFVFLVDLYCLIHACDKHTKKGAKFVYAAAGIFITVMCVKVFLQFNTSFGLM